MKNILNKSFLGMKLYYFIPFWVIGLIGLIVGSFVDKDLSLNMATQGTPYGMFFESWGSVIVTALGPVGVGILAKGLIRKGGKVWLNILGAAVSVGTLAICFYFMFKDLKGSTVTEGYGYTIPDWAAAVVSGILCLGLYSVAYVLADREDSPRIILNGLAILASFAVFQGVLEVFKLLAGRPRFRFLVWSENAYSIDDFRAWWQWSFFNKLDNGGNSDALKSFPSGHVGGVTAYIVLPLVFASFKKTKDNKAIRIGSVIFAYVLAITMAFARIVNGAHFLSDVSFAMILSSLVACLVCLVVSKLPFKTKESEGKKE
ncbi:MAG: phosphatase PAP2 family protein [Bacilli bacterium]|nr:phosphatase PAP2 family protein [Bacilli bacterium]